MKSESESISVVHPVDDATSEGLEIVKIKVVGISPVVPFVDCREAL